MLGWYPLETVLLRDVYHDAVGFLNVVAVCHDFVVDRGHAHFGLEFWV